MMMSFLALGLLAAVVFSFRSQESAFEVDRKLRSTFLRNVFLGLVGMVGMIISGIALSFTQVGLWLGVGLIGLLMVLFVVSLADTAYFFGRLVLSGLAMPARYMTAVAIFGALVLSVLMIMPFISVMASLAVIAAFGSRLQSLWHMIYPHSHIHA